MQQIGRYQIRKEAGRGGMSTVYEAFDPHFQRAVAVKVMTRDLLEDPKLKARFTREAQTIAALEHPAIVPVYDFGEDDKRPYLVMRLMTGGSLAERLNDGPLSVSESARILKRIGSALDRAHAQGIIHRDLKPSNIMFDQYGDAFLADFGIARVTEGALNLTGENVIGTPAYMSPEQIHGDQAIDGRSDIYALGVICFEMLTGQKPYQEKSPAKIMMQHLLDPVPDIRQVRPDLPLGVEEVIARSMAKSPDERYTGAAELTDTLDSLAKIEPLPPPPPAAADLSAAAVSAAATPSLTPDEADDVEVTLPDSAELAAQRVAPEPMPAPAADAQPAATAVGAGRNRKWVAAAAVLVLVIVVVVLGVVFFRESFSSGGNETAEVSETHAGPETGEAALSGGTAAEEQQEPEEPEEPNVRPTVEAQMDRFYAAMEVEDFETADEILHQAIALLPEEAWLQHELSWLRESTDDIEGARLAMEEALALEPDNAEFHARLGSILRKLGDLDPALAHQIQAVELDPENPYFHLELAETFKELGDLDMALEQYDQAIALEDEEAWYYDGRADLHFLRGDYEKGLADLERAAELEPEDRSFFTQAADIFLYDLEDPQQALEYYNLAVERTPDEGWVYADRAEAYSALDDLDAALADLNKAIELDPENALFYIQRSQLYQYYLEDTDAALADLNRAVELDPQNPDVFGERAAFFQYNARDLEAALEDRNQALALDHEGPWRYADRALVFRELGRDDEALADFNACLEIDPAYYWCSWERALLFRDAGQTDEAAADFQRFLEHAPEDDCPECHAEAEQFIRDNG